MGNLFTLVKEYSSIWEFWDSVLYIVLNYNMPISHSIIFRDIKIWRKQYRMFLVSSFLISKEIRIPEFSQDSDFVGSTLKVRITEMISSGTTDTVVRWCLLPWVQSPAGIQKNWSLLILHEIIMTIIICYGEFLRE